MNDNKHNSGGSLGAIVGFIVFIAIIYWIGNSLYEKFYLFAEKNPFWDGTNNLQVCKVPYYSSTDCYDLKVSLIDNDNASIHFSNGGYLDVSGIKCWFTSDYGSGYKAKTRYTFCRSWDNKEQQWDLFPVWARI